MDVYLLIKTDVLFITNDINKKQTLILLYSKMSVVLLISELICIVENDMLIKV